MERCPTEIFIDKAFVLFDVNLSNPDTREVLFGGVTRLISDRDPESTWPRVKAAVDAEYENLRKQKALFLDQEEEADDIRALHPDALFVGLNMLIAEKMFELNLPYDQKIYKGPTCGLGELGHRHRGLAGEAED